MHKLSLKTSVSVNFGAFEEERSQPQTVCMELDIIFSVLPKACETDELEDTIDYSIIQNGIQDMCSARPYKLLENLCYEAFNLIKEKWLPDASLKLTMTKNPPHASIETASFTISDID